MNFVSIVTKNLALGTIVAQIFVVACAVYFVFLRKKFKKTAAFLAEHGLLFAFLTALMAMASSLFYSNVAMFPPCDLCWFQRICMYPLVLILFVALIKKKDARVLSYALPLAITGFFISLYHNVIYYMNSGLKVFCDMSGSGISCTKRYIFEFGYITIPLMALTGFALVICFLLFVKLKND